MGRQEVPYLVSEIRLVMFCEEGQLEFCLAREVMPVKKMVGALKPWMAG